MLGRSLRSASSQHWALRPFPPAATAPTASCVPGCLSLGSTRLLRGPSACRCRTTPAAAAPCGRVSSTVCAAHDAQGPTAAGRGQGRASPSSSGRGRGRSSSPFGGRGPGRGSSQGGHGSGPQGGQGVSKGRDHDGGWGRGRSGSPGNGGRHPGRGSPDAGRGRGRGSSLDGRGSSGGSDRGAGRGHNSIGRGSSPAPSDDPRSARDLGELWEWAQARAGMASVPAIGNALSKAAKLGSRPGADRALLTATMAALAEAYLPRVAGLRSPMGCTLPLWACAKVGYWEGGLVAALMARLVGDGGALLQRANGQGHANVWWALSVAPEALVASPDGRRLLDASAGLLPQLSAAELGSSQVCSNVLLACARLKYGSSPALLHHLTACLGDEALEASEQSLANALYALGELRTDCGHTPRPQDVQRLAERVKDTLQQRPGRQPGSFVPQALSNMLLGCAKLGYSDPALLQPLAQAAGKSARQMVEQALSNSLYALAVLDVKEPVYTAVISALGAEISARGSSRFEPQNLSNILYSLALLQSVHGAQTATVQALAAECASSAFHGFKPQDLSNATWALAKVGYSNQGWYAAAVAAAVQTPIMQTATAQDWSNLWYALALARHRPEGLLERMCGRSGDKEVPLAHLSTYGNAQGCANILWALAVLGLYDEHLVDVLVARLGDLLLEEQLAEQDISSSLWALSAMPEGTLSCHRCLVEELLREAARRGPGAFPEEYLNQFRQLHSELKAASMACASLRGFNALFEAAEQAGQARQVDTNPTTSQLQRQVVRALKRLQQQQAATGQLGSPDAAILSVLPEQPVEEVCGRADVLVKLAGGRRVAVEVDGPIHFLANEPHTRDGPTQLRDRQLRRVFGQGNVVSVPYWEWNELETLGEAKRQQYLCRLLGLR